LFLATAADIWARAVLTGILVNMLLHLDQLVRVAAASLAFNASGPSCKSWGREEVVDGIRKENRVVNSRLDW
jgi:hypothetical protein